MTSNRATGLRAPVALTRTLMGLTLLCGVITAPRALACSAPNPGLSRSHEPPSGTVDVPVNAQIRVRYREWGGSFLGGMKPPALVDNAGAPVDGKTTVIVNHRETVFVIAPAAPLKPQSTYTVRDYTGSTSGSCVPMAGPGTPCTDTQVDAAIFSTGDSADTVKPTFAGLHTITQAYDSCGSTNCCGPYAGWRMFLQWDPATDNRPASGLRYNIYGPGGKLRGAFMTSGHATTGSGYLLSQSNLGKADDGAWSVCAVDIAGNEACPGPELTWTTPTSTG